MVGVSLVLAGNHKGDTMCRFGIGQRQSGVVEIGQRRVGLLVTVLLCFQPTALAQAVGEGKRSKPSEHESAVPHSPISAGVLVAFNPDTVSKTRNSDNVFLFGSSQQFYS